MDWQLQVFAFFGAVAAILAVGWTLDSGMDANPQLKGRLGLWLQQNVAKELKAWLQSANKIFLYAFDKMYGGRFSIAEQTAWAGLFLSPVGLAFMAIMQGADGTSLGETADVLLFAIILAFVYASVWLTSKGLRSRNLVIILVGIFCTIFGAIVSGTMGVPIAGVVSGIFSFRDVVTALIGLFAGVGGFVLISLIVRVPKIPVHPLKALFWSLVFVCAVGVIARDAGRAFVMAIYADPKVLGFVAFNVFADGVSLLETRWVLQKGATASLKMLAALVVLDLIGSGLIYLILPTILWPQIQEFWEAVRFTGETPWLGILFWTTFSTSFLFYLFVAAALLARPLTAGLSLFGWLSQPFGLETHPVRCLAVAMAVVVTVGFLVGGLVQAV
jgi:hypothetical protein